VLILFSPCCQLCVCVCAFSLKWIMVQPRRKAELCHASRRWGNVNRVTVVLIIMAACCRGFNYQSSLKPCVMRCTKYRAGRGKNPWHFLKIKRGVRAWSANSCAIWSDSGIHCRDRMPLNFSALCSCVIAGFSEKIFRTLKIDLRIWKYSI